MSAKKPAAKTDEELVRELREFHHYESARRLEQLSRLSSAVSATKYSQVAVTTEKEDSNG